MHALIVALLLAQPPAPPVVELRPDDAQIARVVETWEAAGITCNDQVPTPTGGRCDLVAGGFAWEIESHARDWNTGIGQSAYYAADLGVGLKPGLMLIVDVGEERYAKRATIAAERTGVTLLVVAPAGDVPLPPPNRGPITADEDLFIEEPPDDEPGELGARAGARSPDVTTPGEPGPSLVITVADRNCPPCERWEADFRRHLPEWGIVEGKHYRIIRVPYGTATTPTFAYRGKVFAVGYGGWSDWRAKVSKAAGLE